MRPFLFSGTVFETQTYYVLYLLAFLGAIILASYRARAFELNPVRAVDVGIVSLISGVAGARIFHILFEAPDYYLMHPIRVFYLWQGGFVLYGGLIVGFLSVCVFLRLFKESIALWADALTPALFLGIGIGRMGCLAAGCCYGRQTGCLWGLIFSNPRSAAPLHVPLHPTQILEAVFAFFLCGIFLYVFRRPSKRLPAAQFVWGMMIYAVFRFGIEFLRGDADRGLYFDDRVSTSQMVSLFVVISALSYILSAWSRKSNFSKSA